MFIRFYSKLHHFFDRATAPTIVGGGSKTRSITDNPIIHPII